MKEIISKIASFVWDIPIEKTSSKQNEYLEVVWTNGRKMLNTKDANFSFGNGYKVFEKALSLISDEVHSSHRVLILGFGCGSILDLLEKKYRYEGEIHGVEYDPVIIDLYQRHFASNYQNKPIISIDDAESFVSNSNQAFDIIFIDLFLELENSSLIFKTKFIEDTSRLLSDTGVLVFNTTNQSQDDQRRLTELMMSLGRKYKDVSKTVFQDLNNIIIAK
ncbi:MAG: spermidine synthase [Bacteroidia bacterium]